MKSLIVLIAFIAAVQCQAQTPDVYSWIRNLTGATGYNNIPSNVQSLSYTTTDVYVSATCIPGYGIGPWAGLPPTQVPVNENFIYKITRNPQPNSGTPTSIGFGHVGVWTNGVSIFNAQDAYTYNNQGVWHRDAIYFEGSTFDNCLGHPSPNGEYHNHLNPRCLYNDKDSTRHSPIIGYSFDGYPIYGAYAFADSTSLENPKVTRMRSSYRKRSITTRTTLPNGSTASSAGPAVSASYPVGYFLEDYEYVQGLGDLDQRNGRHCVTPEYPNGTYAYFVTIDDQQKAVFPYVMINSYYGVVQTGNTGPMGGHNVVPSNATKFSSAFAPSITVIPSANPICSGTSVTFSTSIVNGGTVPKYQWKLNNTNVGTGASTYTAASVSDGDVVTCEVTSDAYYLTMNTATSAPVTMKVNQSVAPSVTISAPLIDICSGDHISFSALPVNGGTAPIYQWKKNGANVGIGGSLYMDSTFADNDVVSCDMTSNSACASTPNATSNRLVVHVTARVTPSVEISTTNTTVPQGTTVVFTANAINGGTQPVYRWTKNGTTVGGNDKTYTDNALKTGDVIHCMITSNAGCLTKDTATSNGIAMTVTSVSGVRDEYVTARGTRLTLAPNPASTMVTIHVESPVQGTFRATIYSLLGAQMSSSSDLPTGAEHTLGLTGFPAGSYFLVIRTSSGEEIRRMLTVQ